MEPAWELPGGLHQPRPAHRPGRSPRPLSLLRATNRVSLPRVTVSIRATVGRLLDVTDRSIRSSLRLSRKRLVSEPWRIKQESGDEALTQAFGRVVKQSGLEGMLVPSAASRSGVNLILLPENLLPRSHLEIINVDQLPCEPRP